MIDPIVRPGFDVTDSIVRARLDVTEDRQTRVGVLGAHFLWIEIEQCRSHMPWTIRGGVHDFLTRPNYNLVAIRNERHTYITDVSIMTQIINRVGEGITAPGRCRSLEA